MPRLHHRHLPLLCLLVLSLLAGQTSAFGYVWCIGADGHTRIEGATNGACGEAEDTCPPAPGDLRPSLSSADEHCGPCLDLPPAGDTLQNRSRPSHDFDVLLLPPAIAQAPAGPVFIRTLTANLIPDPPPRPHETLLALRTVVLRH
jgi:hypothetical protein